MKIIYKKYNIRNALDAIYVLLGVHFLVLLSRIYIHVCLAGKLYRIHCSTLHFIFLDYLRNNVLCFLFLCLNCCFVLLILISIVVNHVYRTTWSLVSYPRYDTHDQEGYDTHDSQNIPEQRRCA